MKKIPLPNGKSYKVSEKKWDKDWSTVETIQAHWSEIKKSGNDGLNFPDVLPANTKFYRSRSRDKGIFIKIPGCKKYQISVDALPDAIKTKIAPLKHSFKLLPVSNDSSAALALYAIQHEDNKSKYIDFKKKEGGKKSRVKFAIPKNSEHSIRVYKTKEKNLLAFPKGVATDLRIGDPFYCEENKKTSILMEFGGRKNLWDVMNSRSLSSKKVSDLARLCCERVEKLHVQDIILDDIKPDNFILSDDLKKVFLIDMEESMVAKNALASQLVLVKTPGYFIENELSSQACDMYGLGVTLGELAAAKSSHLRCLAALMGRKKPEERFTIQQAMQWFSLLERSNGFIEGITVYYKPFTVVPSAKGSFFEGDAESLCEEVARRKNIHDFLAYLKVRENDNQLLPLSIFQLEAIACLFKHFPERIEPKNWEKLCAQEVDAALVGTLAGVGEYLDSPRGSYANPAGGEGAVRVLVTTLLTTENITSKAIGEAIRKANDSTKPSKNTSQSRRTIFNKYEHIARVLNNKKTEDREKTHLALLLLGKHFPHLNLYHQKIIHDPDALLAKIIVKSVTYLESDTAGWLGKRSIKCLVNDLLTHKKTGAKLIQSSGVQSLDAQLIITEKLEKYTTQYKFATMWKCFMKKTPDQNVRKRKSRQDMFAEEIERLSPKKF